MRTPRLGLHWMSPDADDSFRRYVDAVRPPFVKMLDPGAGEEPLAAWCLARGVNTIGRVYFKDQYLGAEGARQIRSVVAHALSAPSIRYWELHNEAWHVPGEMDRYAALSIDFMNAMTQIGRVAVIGCFAEGTPQVDGSDNHEAWRQYAPAVRYAIQRGHVLGLHEYSAFHMAALVDPDGRGWHTLRYRRSLEILKSFGLDIARLKVALTETGLDDIQDPGRQGPPGKGWRDYDGTPWAQKPTSPHGDFAGQMAWYCTELGKDPQIIGLVDFGWAPRDRASWDSFDLSVVPAMIGRMIEEMQRLPAPQPPNGGPTVTDEKKLAIEAQVNQEIQFNPTSALQKAAVKRGLEGPSPNSDEWRSGAGRFAGHQAQRFEWADGRVEVATWNPVTGEVAWTDITELIEAGG